MSIGQQQQARKQEKGGSEGWIKEGMDQEVEAIRGRRRATETESSSGEYLL